MQTKLSKVIQGLLIAASMTIALTMVALLRRFPLNIRARCAIFFLRKPLINSAPCLCVSALSSRRPTILR